jgi:hypothetical protein
LWLDHREGNFLQCGGTVNYHDAVTQIVTNVLFNWAVFNFKLLVSLEVLCVMGVDFTLPDAAGDHPLQPQLQSGAAAVHLRRRLESSLLTVADSRQWQRGRLAAPLGPPLTRLCRLL